MIDLSIKARLIARVLGLPAVAVVAIAALIGIGFTPMESWLKLIALLLDGSVLVASAVRIFKGGEQGPTDLEITDGPRRIAITNIPLSQAVILSRGLGIYGRRPMPRPAGVVTGNPAETANVVELASAALPENTDVAREPLQIPPGAATLSVVGGVNVRAPRRDGDPPPGEEPREE